MLQGETADTINDYLTATENASGGVDIFVDADGKPGGETMTIVLDGLRFNDNGTTSGEDFLQKLIQDNNLIIDK